MEAYENTYQVVVITEAENAAAARREQEEALASVAYEITFLGGESA